MRGISTHVLDIALGQPAVGVPVQLERADEAGLWHEIASQETDVDGRCQLLPAEEPLPPGKYRLRFGTARYYEAQGMTGLYPLVEITFEARDQNSRFHIPLLLSPNGYTTYRGS
jgi:5-hydroxyisourate hydrolase